MAGEGGSRRHVWVMLLGVLGIALSMLAAQPALAAKQHSSAVAIVEGTGASSVGPLQLSGSVAGAEQDSFDGFAFTEISQEEVNPATLANYDTVVLNEVFTNSLTEEQKQTLSSFVTSGGKLIIHDADGTTGNEYSWLPVPAATGNSCENCGNLDGEGEVVENNAIVSNDPSSPSYVNVGELPGNSDAVGDANVLLTNDPRWNEDVVAKNQQNVEGAADAYASDGGLILYNGFDWDYSGSVFPSGTAWLNKLWFDELNLEWDPDSLPHGTPVVGASGHCGFRSLRIGVATVCAETFSSSGTETTASGHVVLDGGVSVGEGPIQINRETKQISATAPVPIGLLRGGGELSLGTAAFTIDATGTTDPISGKAGLAKVSLTAANLGSLGALRVGGLAFAAQLSGALTTYMDGSSGGGLILAGNLQLPMLGKLQSSGGVSLGFYAGSPTPVVPLGAAVHFGSVDFGKGWKFDGLDLSYQQSSDTWTASGGIEVPIASLNASGSVVGGKLDSLAVAIGGLTVPLGDSGFFFSGFGGGVSGLAHGPLRVDASTEGFWGVPKLPVEPFYLDKAKVTVDFGGSITLDGAVSFAFKDHSPLHGSLDLSLGINPFSAGGTATLEGSLPGVTLKAHGGAAFTAKHFTAAEGGSLKIFGLSGDGEVIVSDRGLGASGTLCAPFHLACQTMAIAGTWSQIGKLDIPALVGGEPRKLVTVSGVAATGRRAAAPSASVRIPQGRALLVMTVTGTSGSPHVKLRAPGGRTFDSARRNRAVVFTSQPQYNLTTIAVLRPRAGTWRVSAAPGEAGPLRVKAQTTAPMSLVRAARITPVSSARHPLRAHSHLLLRWSSANLPAGVRVAIVRHSQAHEIGVGLAGNLGARGQLSVPVSKLAPGRNYITLAATLNGVPFQQVTFGGQAWRAAPKHKRAHKRGRR